MGKLHVAAATQQTAREMQGDMGRPLGEAHGDAGIGLGRKGRIPIW